MQKSKLKSVIEKYYLNKKTEKVRISVKNKIMSISFVPDEHRSLMGQISCERFDLIDCEFGVYNTTQLIKIIKILEEDIKTDIQFEKKTPVRMMFSDKEYSLEFILADLELISKVPKIKEPETYDIELSIDKDFITKFLNAEKALDDVKRFTVESNQLNQNAIIFQVGEKSSYSNLVRFEYNTSSLIQIPNIPFQTELFSALLEANKNCDLGLLKISKDGLMRIDFKEGDITSVYYLVRLEE